MIETGSLGANGLFSVAGDASGNLHLAYNSSATSNVAYRRWDAATRAWSGASVSGTRPASGTYGAASVTTAGDEVYVFVQYAVGSNQSILTVRRQVDGKWEPSEQVLTDPWERTFDQVWSTSGAEWHDLTAAAASVASNDLVHPATNALLRSPDDAVYAGMSERFDYVYTALSTTGRGGSYVWEYWNGAAWTTLPLRENSGPGFTASGAVRFRPPHDWQSQALNGGAARYYVRVRVVVAPTTAPRGTQMTAVKSNRAPATLGQARSVMPLAWTEGIGGIYSIKQRAIGVGPLATVTPTPTASPTNSPTATATETGTPTATETPTPENSPTPTTETGTPTATEMGTPTQTATPEEVPTPTATPLDTDTPTPENSPTPDA